MATIGESVKESLLGTTMPTHLSDDSRANFVKFAKVDENGDLYMQEEEFINAIAPPEEDYVSPCIRLVLRLDADPTFAA